MDLISEIKARTDIIQVISAYVPLKKAGKDYKALCPLHGEKTPSFTVSAEKQLFYCFGCGAGGDLIRFVSLIEKIDTAETIRRLADRLGIERRHDKNRAAPAEPLRRALELAAQFYESVRTSPAGQSAEAYLDRRQMPPDTAKKFRIGYAPDRQDALTKRLMDKGAPEDVLIKSGLTAKDDNGRMRDRFRDRLMFPILDGMGHVVGFGGRVIRDGDRRPKYLNSSENEIFHKGKLLYGYHTARDMVSAQNPPLLVEGYIDVIYAQSAGLAAVAGMGTSLTDMQAELLSRFRLTVLLAYDTDDAGRKAMLRAAKILLAKGVEVGVVEIKGGKDPAELVERGECDTLRAAAANPLDVFAHVVSAAKAMNPSTPVGRRLASDMIGELAEGIRDPLLRQRLIQAYADGFGVGASAAADLLKGVSANRLVAEVKAGTRGIQGRAADVILGEGQSRMEWAAIGVILARPDLMPAAFAEIEDDFSEPDARMVWDVLAAQYERQHEIDFEELSSAFADYPKLLERITSLRLSPPVECGLSAEGFRDLLRRLRRSRLKREIDALRARLKAAEAGKKYDEVRQLMEETQKIQGLLSAIEP